MPQTRNYANLGQVTWRAEVGLADNSDPHARTVAEREFRSARSKGLAKAFVTATLHELRNPPETPDGDRPYYWRTIQRGSYNDCSFNDSDDGQVSDAAWKPDEDAYGEQVTDHAYLTDDGQVLWQGGQ
jgi:hypothetical protein